MITAMPRIAIAVHDFAGAISTFRDRFGMPVADFSARTVADLGAHVGMCMPAGGSNIELMAPADPTKPLSQTLQKFLDRRGDGLYALMLEAPDPNAEAVVLAARGLEVMALMAGAGGRDIHPRSTSGVLIRVYPDNSVRDPGGLAVAEPGLSGIAKVIVATADASLAADAYGRGFGLPVGPVTVDEERGVCSVICTPPKGGVIELVSVHDDRRPFAQDIERFVKDRGQGMYALVLRADDRPAIAARLQARGIDLRPAVGIDAETASVFGTRFLLG